MELQKTKWKKVNSKIEKAWNYHRYCFNRSIIDGLVRSGIVDENKVVFDECRQSIRRDIKIPLTADVGLKSKLAWVAYAISPTLLAELSARKFKATLAKWGGVFREYLITFFSGLQEFLGLTYKNLNTVLAIRQPCIVWAV